MKLEYIPEGSSDCPLIRISDTSVEDISVLLDTWTSLSRQVGVELPLGLLEGMTAKDNCELVCSAGERSTGVQRQVDSRFLCTLTRAAWERVGRLTEPFLKQQTGYQWLIEDECKELQRFQAV
jgi:hypothetical protein